MNPTNPNAQHLSFAARMQQVDNSPAQQSQRGQSQRPSGEEEPASSSRPGAAAVGQARHPSSRTSGGPTRELRRPPNFRRDGAGGFEIRESTRRNLERQADIAARSKGVQVDLPQPPTVRMKALAYTARGFRTDWDDNDNALRQQNEKMAREIMDFAAVNLPEQVSRHPMMHAYIGNPIDDAPFIPKDDVVKGYEGEKHELLYEWNGGGWGGKGEAPLAQQASMREHQQLLGTQLVGKARAENRMPLVIFGCSGGQPDPETGDRKDNGTMAENIWVIDGIGMKMAEILGGENEISLHFNPESWKSTRTMPNGTQIDEGDHFLTDDKACGMLAYNEIIPYMSRTKEGQILMHETPWPVDTTKEQKKLPRPIASGENPGRPVDCLLNERFVHYIIEAYGPINGNLTWVGPMVGVGTDKAIGYAAFNQFIEQPGIKERFPTFARRIPFAVVDDPDEMIEAIDCFAERKTESIIKPRGTGGGHGIETFDENSWDDDDKMRHMIDESFKVVQNKYLDRGVEAGWPYTVSERVQGAPLEVPEHLEEKFGKYNGLEAEGRQGATQRFERDQWGYPTGIVQCTVVQNTFKVKQAGSKVGNVTTQKEKLGMRNDELMLPGTQPHVMEILSYDEEMYKNRARFLSEAQAFILTKVAAQRTANPMVDTTTHPFGELPKLPYPV